MAEAPIIFANVPYAVRWSEEVATLPDMGSCLGNLISGPSSGRMSRQEMIDIALTVSAMTASCKPYKGLAMLAVYGKTDEARDHALAIALSTAVMRNEYGRTKTHKKIITLAVCTIHATRSRKLYSKRYPHSRMAAEIGISRKNFTCSKAWPILLAAAMTQMESWMDQANNEIGQQMSELGWIA